MMDVVLTPLTKRGRDKIREAGSPGRWVTLKQEAHIPASPKAGPWLFLCPLGVPGGPAKARWVHARDDPDFRVEAEVT